MPSDTHRGVPVPEEFQDGDSYTYAEVWWRKGVDAAFAHRVSELSSGQSRTLANDGGQPQTAPDNAEQSAGLQETCPVCGAVYNLNREMGRSCLHAATCTWNGRTP